jgi:glycosyltransferase involved in cell wall biosynthesis
MKILDYYCHQGHQYEFFKTGHEFYLTGLDSLKPNWNTAHRPLPPNVTLIDEKSAHNIKFDVVIVRSPLNLKRYERFMRRGAVPVAVAQTTSPYPVSPKVRHMVWNSLDTMNKHSGYYHRRVKHHYIVHGFDPDEFHPIPSIERNGRVLAISNVYKARNHFLDYNTFHRVSNKLQVCDVVGHGNDDIPEAIGEATTFEELVLYHNMYSVYLNTTIRSAMPRGRAEAAMSGMPICSTCNYDIGRYFTHNKDIVFANNYPEMVRELNKLLKNPKLAAEIGARGRETAIKHFHINDFVGKWNSIFESL